MATVNILPESFRLGDRLSIKRVLGQGGMGIVYLALDEMMENEPRAVKTIRPDVLGDPKCRKDLRKEASAAQRLSHPNIVRVFHYDEWEGLCFIVMEYVKGRTLAELLAAKERLGEGEFSELAQGICAGLAYAHEEGILHQDLKPSNIIIDDKGRPKLVDFGIARVMSDSTTRLTGRVPRGSMLYMPPEVLDGNTPDVRSDIYSLGIVFYEMLSGSPPFVRGDIYRQHQEKKPGAVSGVSAALNGMLQRMLEKDPRRRPGSAQEILPLRHGKESRSEPDAGILVVTLNLAGAEIFVDGSLAASAGEAKAVTLSNIAPGEHLVTVEKPGHRSSVRDLKVSINRGARTDITAIIEPTSVATDDYIEGLREYESGNLTEAVALLQRAAEAGNAEAQFVLGNLYAQGKGVRQDYEAALRLYETAAESGYPPAQRNLGTFYFNGKGTRQNAAVAANWYHRAAMQGDHAAQCYLGIMYQKGIGVKKNPAESTRLLKMAARRSADKQLKDLAEYYLDKRRRIAKIVDWIMETIDSF